MIYYTMVMIKGICSLVEIMDDATLLLCIGSFLRLHVRYETATFLEIRAGILLLCIISLIVNLPLGQITSVEYI